MMCPAAPSQPCWQWAAGASRVSRLHGAAYFAIRCGHATFGQSHPRTDSIHRRGRHYPLHRVPHRQIAWLSRGIAPDLSKRTGAVHRAEGIQNALRNGIDEHQIRKRAAPAAGADDVGQGGRLPQESRRAWWAFWVWRQEGGRDVCVATGERSAGRGAL